MHSVHRIRKLFIALLHQRYKTANNNIGDEMRHYHIQTTPNGKKTDNVIPH